MSVMQAYAKLRTDTPELLDLVAQFAGQDLTDDPMAVDGSSTAPAANPGEFHVYHMAMHAHPSWGLVGWGAEVRGAVPTLTLFRVIGLEAVLQAELLCKIRVEILEK